MDSPVSNVSSKSKPVDESLKTGLILGLGQLDMMIQAFAAAGAPERVKKAAEEFKAALKEWAGV